MIALLKVAEEINQTEYIFSRLNMNYNIQVQQQSKMLSTIMEPIIILIVGILVGVILIAILLTINHKMRIYKGVTPWEMNGHYFSNKTTKPSAPLPVDNSFWLNDSSFCERVIPPNSWPLIKR